jgi:hypothetical protein
MCSCLDVLPYHRLKEMRPINYGLEPLKLSRNTPFLFIGFFPHLSFMFMKLVFIRICSLYRGIHCDKSK